MRTFSTTFRAALEAPYNDDPPMVFITIEHDSLVAPIRCVYDVVDYVLDGDTYVGFPFDVVLVSDSEDAPRGRLSVQNVDRIIGEAVRELSSPPKVTIEIYPASDFDLTVRPRVPLGIPQLAYRAAFLYLRNVSVDVLTASGDLTSWEYANLPWPSKFATQALLPGLFR